MTPRASLCPAISRSTTRRNRSSSPSLMLPSIEASPFAPPRGPPGLALARSCRSSEQLPQAVRTDQCRTKEGRCKEPRKPPELVLNAEGRQYATTQGHDARRHKQPEIVKRARGNGALHQSALHCGQSERAASTAMPHAASKARGLSPRGGFRSARPCCSTCRKVLLAFTRPSDPLSHGTRLVDVRLLHPPARYLLSG